MRPAGIGSHAVHEAGSVAQALFFAIGSALVRRLGSFQQHGYDALLLALRGLFRCWFLGHGVVPCAGWLHFSTIRPLAIR